MNNLDTISSISPISFTDINNDNTVTSNTYEEIMNEAKMLNNGKAIVSSEPDNFNVMSVNNGVPSILDTEGNNISDISATSQFDTSILNDKIDLSSTSSAFMEEIAGQEGGVRRKYNKAILESEGDSPSSSSGSDSSSSSSDLSSASSLKSKKSKDSETDSDNSPMSEPESETFAGQGFVSGTRYLYSDTVTETSYNKVNDKSFFEGGSDLSSELNTEDLTLLKN
jgi:hypothetical protein